MRQSVIILLLFFTVYSFCASLRNECEDICETQQCVETSAIVLKNMDSSVAPCDNFYKFACGNYVKKTVIPEDKSTISTYAFVRDIVATQLYSIFEDEEIGNDLEIFRKVKEYYTLCMDLADIEQRAEYPAWAIFKRLGEWPVLEVNWNDKQYSWSNHIVKMMEQGILTDAIIDFGIGTDLKNTSRRILMLDQSSLGMTKEYWLKGKNHRVVHGYLELMIDTVKLFLKGAGGQQVVDDMTEVFNFEKDLSEICLRHVERRNATKLYNPMTLKEIQERYPYINWINFINGMLKYEAVDENEVIVVRVPSYYDKLADLLKHTPKRVLSNYLNWRVAKTLVSYLPKRFIQRRLQYTALVNGKTTETQRWRECIDSSAVKFKLAIGALYVRNFFDEVAKAEAVLMINNIRQVFTRTLKKISWMSDTVRLHALEKMKAITNFVAYPDELMDDKKIEQYYQDFKVEKSSGISFLEYNLEFAKFSHKINIFRLRQPVNRTDWTTHGAVSVVNAFYASSENSIQFPASIFQGMFFGKTRPKYINYGSIGFTIGHEITHGFDDRGRLFDKEGILENWWDEETTYNFLQKAKCIVDQYSAQKVELTFKADKNQRYTVNINGNNSQGENIADNGGLKHAYKAYQRWSQGIVEPRLPGLKQYNQNQMFWISAANKWCSKYRPENMEAMLLSDSHAPGEYRINIPMSNIEAFSRDWNCPVGSNMNPVEKCEVW